MSLEIVTIFFLNIFNNFSCFYTFLHVLTHSYIFLHNLAFYFLYLNLLNFILFNFILLYILFLLFPSILHVFHILHFFTKRIHFCLHKISMKATAIRILILHIYFQNTHLDIFSSNMRNEHSCPNVENDTKMFRRNYKILAFASFFLFIPIECMKMLNICHQYPKKFCTVHLVQPDDIHIWTFFRHITKFGDC